MGQPKKSRKQYKRPLVIWQSELIADQKKLTRDYGLKNKKEIYRAEGIIGRIRSQAKNLIALKTTQSEKEKKQLITRLVKLGLIKPTSELEEVLALTINDILERRLQTVVFKRNLTKTVKQARQFIVHGHISVNENKVNVPSYLVDVDSESKIKYNPSSELANDQHPERIKEKSRKEDKGKKTRLDETDIFAGEKPEEEVKKEVLEKPKEEKAVPTKSSPKTEIPKEEPKKEEIKKVDEVTPTENKTRENEDKSAGKEN